MAVVVFGDQVMRDRDTLSYGMRMSVDFSWCADE